MAAVPVTVRVPARRPYLLVMLNALANLNRLQLQQAPQLPRVYSGTYRYVREQRDPATGQRKEQWRTFADMLEAGGQGDCEDLAAARVASLREQGINAQFWLTRKGRMWHVQVRLPGGRIEDPSKRLGMKGSA